MSNKSKFKKSAKKLLKLFKQMKAAYKDAVKSQSKEKIQLIADNLKVLELEMKKSKLLLSLAGGDDNILLVNGL